MERYFYLNSNNEQAGPVSPTDFNQYGINEATMVWKAGMPNWMRAGQLPELSQFFSSATPPPPVGGNNNGSGAYNRGNNMGNYGNNVGGQYKPIKPDNNMVWAVLTTLFCCFPLGIYSVVQASKVNGLYNTGNYSKAQRMADDAKKWACIGAISGFVIIVINIIMGIAAA